MSKFVWFFVLRVCEYNVRDTHIVLPERSVLMQGSQAPRMYQTTVLAISTLQK